MRAELRLAGLSSLPCAHRIEQALRTLSGVERAVGTGGAGTAAAIRGSDLGASVAIAEGADVVGGTCVNVGCIPSRFLSEAAHHFHTARTAFPGIESCDPLLAWVEVQRRKRQIVETLRQEKYVDVLASYEGITLLRGRAQLLGGGRMRVGEQEVKARKVIRVSRADAGYTIHLEGGSLPGEIRAEQLLVATGRRPNTDDLGLEAAGVIRCWPAASIRRRPNFRRNHDS